MTRCASHTCHGPASHGPWCDRCARDPAELLSAVCGALESLPPSPASRDALAAAYALRVLCDVRAWSARPRGGLSAAGDAWRRVAPRLDLGGHDDRARAVAAVVTLGNAAWSEIAEGGR